MKRTKRTKRTNNYSTLLIILSSFIFVSPSYGQGEQGQALNVDTIKMGETKMGVAPQGSSHAQLGIGKDRNPWSFFFWSVASVRKPYDFEISSLRYDADSAVFFSYSYLNLSYRLNSQDKVSLRAPFLYMSINKDEKKYIPNNLFFAFARKGVFETNTLKGNVGARLYLPTSQSAFDSGMIGGIRVEGSVEFRTGSWKWTYAFKPDFYYHKQNIFRDSSKPFDPRKPGASDRASKFAELEHYIEGERALTSLLGFRPYLGFEEDWTNAASLRTGSNRESLMIARLGLDLNLYRKLSFSVGLENRTDVSAGRAANYQFLANQDNQLFLITYAEI